VNPKALMLAAICRTWCLLCVLAFWGLALSFEMAWRMIVDGSSSTQLGSFLFLH